MSALRVAGADVLHARGQKIMSAGKVGQATGQKSMSTGNSVFEAVDATSDEQYWTLGIWPTLEAALAAFAGCQEPGDFGCDDHDDYDDVCVVEIRERAIGWSGVGKKRATLTWTSKYDEAADEYKWQCDLLKQEIRIVDAGGRV